ncbi:uncharacterized protein K02A2.6-like [Anneissia japonica]|uniref:uncharacterized protein K02A2.6-like n=1 Tax=Anneissia japonica TaxID=1529436 RepID=UPI0014257378|nr:uncharacterized protein K02A2.6-like [Anneissia japonica]
MSLVRQDLLKHLSYKQVKDNPFVNHSTVNKITATRGREHIVVRSYRNIIGKIKCDVIDREGITHKLSASVADYRYKPTLLGLDWMAVVKLDWKNIVKNLHSRYVNSCAHQNDVSESQCSKTVGNSNSELNVLFKRYENLFEDSYDGMRHELAHINIRENVTPVYVKARFVPYANKCKVENELKKLEDNNVIHKVKYSDWATPIVVVPKSDGTVRICGDYSVTINKFIDDEVYNLPSSDDLYAELAGKRVFTKLDLSHAYAQLNLDKQSKSYVTINTHKGLYSYNKLPYGVKPASKIFQGKMDKILNGIENCLCNQDDVLISTETVNENLAVIKEVFQRFEHYNVRLKPAKCQFLMDEIKHTCSPVYHAATNGAAERAVRVVKEALTKQVLDGNSKQ